MSEGLATKFSKLVDYEMINGKTNFKSFQKFISLDILKLYLTAQIKANSDEDIKERYTDLLICINTMSDELAKTSVNICIDPIHLN